MTWHSQVSTTWFVMSIGIAAVLHFSILGASPKLHNMGHIGLIAPTHWNLKQTLFIGWLEAPLQHTEGKQHLRTDAHTQRTADSVSVVCNKLMNNMAFAMRKRAVLIKLSCCKNTINTLGKFCTCRKAPPDNLRQAAPHHDILGAQVKRFYEPAGRTFLCTSPHTDFRP